MSAAADWSRALDIGRPRSISAAAGLVVVSGAEGAVAHDLCGNVRWRNELPAREVRAIRDGRTLLRLENRVHILGAGGERLGGWSSSGWYAPHPYSGDRWIDVEGGIDEAWLTCRAADGNEVWRVALDCRASPGATIVGHDIVVSDDSGLRIHDGDGTQRRKAGVVRPYRGQAAMTGPVLELGDYLLASFREVGWRRCRRTGDEITAFGPGAPALRIACVSRDAFFQAALETTDAGLQYVVAFDTGGHLLWKMPFCRIAALEGIPGGVALMSSPTTDYFDLHRDLLPVGDWCRVTLVERGGVVRRELIVGEPLAPMSAHVAQQLFVVLDSGALWCIDTR